MGKFNTTKSFFSNTIAILSAISTIAVGAVAISNSWRFEMSSYFLDCSTNQGLCVILDFIASSFFVALALWLLIMVLCFIFDLLRISFTEGLPSIVKKIKEPSKKNLSVRSGSLHGNIFTLKFKNTEWRYPSAKCFVHVGMANSLNFLTWRETKDFRPFPVKRFKEYEFDFVKVNKEGNSIKIASDKEVHSFSVGVYPFTIVMSCRMLANSGVIDIHKEVYTLIEYKGSDNVSVFVFDDQEKAKIFAGKLQKRTKTVGMIW